MPRILLIEDDRNQADTLAQVLSAEGHEVHQAHSGRQAIADLDDLAPHLILSDLRLGDVDGLEVHAQARKLAPQAPFIILTAHASVGGAVEALKAGVFHYVQKPVNVDELLSLVRRALEVTSLRDENRALKQELARTGVSRAIIGQGQAMQQVLEQVDQIAASEATVMIRGESGTGKELVAEAIHRGSQRADGPLVKVNCAAIPDTLLESELFGHEKGAFTGAHAERKGRFELANGGTIFLDEIGEMPAALQVKLLRVLQEREFERLGGNRTIPVDVRILAATNKDLEELVREERFREDLYYRINVVPLRLPPLRERREDVPLLAHHFLARMNEKNNRELQGFTREAVDKLMRYHWPGNVRELENCIERAVVLARGDKLDADDIPLNPLMAGPAGCDVYEQYFAMDLSLDELEKNLIEEALRRCDGNQSAAAKLLGLTRRTLQYRVEKYDIAVPGKSLHKAGHDGDLD